MASTNRKITVNLPQETIDRLKELADEQGITATAALRQAIETESFLRKETTEKNAVVLIKDQTSGETKQLVFR